MNVTRMMISSALYLVLGLAAPLAGASVACAQESGTAVSAQPAAQPALPPDDVAGQAAVSPEPAVPSAGTPLPLGIAPEGVGQDTFLSAETAPENMSLPVKVENLPSLFFTFWEHNAIQDAVNARGVARTATESELAVTNLGNAHERIKPPPEERELRLGGIVYTRKGDWTVWLNEKRITPDALPPEAIELRVYKDYVEMKWLDSYTQRIFPIRLRPHQRFNLDSRIFLPG